MANSEPNELMPGLTVEELADGDIVIISVTETSRPVVEAFVEFGNNRSRTQANKQFEYMLIDQSESATTNAPHGKAKPHILIDEVPSDKAAYAALVLSRASILQLAQTFLRTLTREGTMLRLFFTRQEGIAWLEQMHEMNTGTDGSQ